MAGAATAAAATSTISYASRAATYADAKRGNEPGTATVCRWVRTAGCSRDSRPPPSVYVSVSCPNAPAYALVRSAWGLELLVRAVQSSLGHAMSMAAGRIPVSAYFQYLFLVRPLSWWSVCRFALILLWILEPRVAAVCILCCTSVITCYEYMESWSLVRGFDCRWGSAGHLSAGGLAKVCCAYDQLTVVSHRLSPALCFQ